MEVRFVQRVVVRPRGAAGVGGDDARAARQARLAPSAAEERARNQNHRAVAAADDGAKGALNGAGKAAEWGTGSRHDQLVRVEEEHPRFVVQRRRRAAEAVVEGGSLAVRVRAALTPVADDAGGNCLGRRPRHAGHEVGGLVWREYFGGSVGRVVVVHKHARDADGRMMVEPLAQRARLVANERAHRDGHGGPLPRRRWAWGGAARGFPRHGAEVRRVPRRRTAGRR
mmetsp:Transcript_4820/g.14821  ORF Transcript_4820/g.14821 Transcript_4820/m.14821 type:complete len:227 (-) Transcript_4820:504-1184(-)